MRYFIQIFIIAMILFSSTIILSADWDTKEKALFGTFVLGQIQNYRQINEIYERDDKGEFNGWIEDIHDYDGMRGVAVWKAGTVLWTAILADRFDHKWRKRVLYGVNIIVWGLVAHDYICVGINGRF